MILDVNKNRSMCFYDPCHFFIVFHFVLSCFTVGIIIKNAIKSIFGICLLQCFVQSLRKKAIVLRTLLLFTFSHLSVTTDKESVKETEENIGELEKTRGCP